MLNNVYIDQQSKLRYISSMPVCKACDGKFPNFYKIDGQQRNLSRRSFCLSCSPFGKHNTRDPRNLSGPVSDTEVTCECGRIYFYNSKIRKGHTITKCNSCMANAHKNKRKKMAVEYKGGKCIMCGYAKCLRSLSFHHRDPAEKDFGIGGSHARSWDAAKKELDKCDLLCANCHYETHDKEEAGKYK